MSSITLTLTGDSSQLSAQYCPAIDLSDDGGGEYVCGLVDFQTFNSIPNIDESNNLFYFGHTDPVEYTSGNNNNNNNTINNDNTESNEIYVDNSRTKNSIELLDNNNVGDTDGDSPNSQYEYSVGEKKNSKRERERGEL